MEDYVAKEKEKELKELFDLVREKFPEIKVDIGCKYADNPSGCPLCVKFYTTRPSSFYGSRIQAHKMSYLKGITICASDNYFTLPFDEKLSGIAHELGHVKHDTKSLNPKRLYRDDEWSKQVFGLNSLPPHKAARIRKWALMRELYADAQAASKGYGMSLLSVLKRLKPSPENVARIKNLETLLNKP